MVRAPRATDATQKAERREAILLAARELHRTVPFGSLTMAQVAEAAGVAKGTLYLSFPTKEALFLDLLEGAYDTWFQAVILGLPKVKGAPSLARLLTRSVVETPDFQSLVVLGPTVLEHNIPLERALAHKHFLLQGTGSLAERLEAKGLVKAGQGLVLLLRLHALVIGLHPHAAPAPVVDTLLERPELSPFRLDFAAALEGCLLDLLRGMEH